MDEYLNFAEDIEEVGSHVAGVSKEELFCIRIKEYCPDMVIGPCRACDAGKNEQSLLRV